MADPEAQSPPRTKRRHPATIIGWALALLVVVALALVAAVRVLPATDAGRAFLETRLEGAKVGRLGHVHLSGIGGDLWGRFTVQTLSIDDRDGPWLLARDIRITWRPEDLLRARVHIATLSVGHLTVARRFVLTPAGPQKPSPVSIKIDHIAGVVETMPAFSVNRGLFAVGGQVLVRRSGAPTGAAEVRSLLHAGDRLHAYFAFGRKGAFDLRVAAREAKGGALAGALGLAADRDFALNLAAHAKHRVGGFDLIALSGGERAADATGRWTKAGGDARGRISLAASTLLAPYQALIGPEIRFQAAGRAVTRDLYHIDLAAGGDKAAVTATGVVDPARQATGAGGVKLALRIDTPTLMIKTGASGPLRLNGGLGATPKHWVFDGAADLQKPAFAGLSYTRVFGPLRLEGIGKQIGVRTILRGEGGVGGGFAAGLLGSAPTASADVDILGDGRTILRKISLDGADVKVSGEGRQGLLGDLSFSGQAAVADLARAKLGARGGVSGAWSAKQSGRSPWVFTVDAKGDKFSLGVEQIDHLLGPAPTLQAKGAVDGGVVNLEQAAVNGKSGAITAAGRIGPDGALKIATTWRVTGPLPVGPIEIDGAVKGTGDIGGTLASPTADLIADLPQLDLPTLPLRDAHVVARLQSPPSGVTGRFSLAATSEYGPASARAAFGFAGGGIEVSGLDADAGGLKVAGGFALKDATPSSADLVFSAGPGAFLDTGHAAGHARIVDAPGGPRADLAVTATEAQMRGGPLFHSLKLSADGPLRRLAYRADVAGLTSGTPFRLTGTGVYSQAPTAGADNAISFEGSGKVRGVDVHTTAPARLTFAGDRYGAALALGVGGGKVVARVDGVGPKMSGHATLSDLALTAFDPDYTGVVSGDVSVEGSGPSLGGTLSARVANVGLKGQKGAAPLDGDIEATLAGSSLRVATDLTAGKGAGARINVVLPVEASSSPFRIAIARLKPMTGDFAIDAELAPLWDLTMGDGQTLSGHLVADGTLGGTLADPRLLGTAALSNGRFADSSTGLKLQNVSLSATLRDNAIDVSTLEGKDAGKGSVSGSGRIGLERNGVSDLQLVLKGFRLIDNDLGQATASGKIDVNRAADGKVKLSGALTIDHAQIAPNAPTPSGVVPMDVVEIHQKVDPDTVPDSPSQRAAPVELNVTLTAPGGVFIKGRGLNVEFSLDAKVTGSTTDPVLTGSARVIRGDYDFAGQRFTLGEDGVVHLGSTPETIRLDLTATRDNPTLTAVIRITGTAAKPVITLTSTPVLPQDEVLSQVLFGSSVSSLNGFQAAQLASALSGLASGGGFDVIGGIRNFAHLDRLAINSTVTSTTATGRTLTTSNSVAGGKYLTNKVYLELSGGAQGPGAQIEWRVTKHLAFVSHVTSQGDQAVSIRWRKDY
jgi:translocation and assembly module TamB